MITGPYHSNFVAILYRANLEFGQLFPGGGDFFVDALGVGSLARSGPSVLRSRCAADHITALVPRWKERGQTQRRWTSHTGSFAIFIRALQWKV